MITKVSRECGRNVAFLHSDTPPLGKFIAAHFTELEVPCIQSEGRIALNIGGSVALSVPNIKAIAREDVASLRGISLTLPSTWGLSLS